MPVVCDFTVVQDGTANIGDAGTAVFERSFGTGGRHNSAALLMMMVTGLTDRNAEVRINNQLVGRIPRHNATAGWVSEHFVVRPGILSSSGANELQINAVPAGSPSAGNVFDDFSVRDVVCFFHQAA